MSQEDVEYINLQRRRGRNITIIEDNTIYLVEDSDYDHHKVYDAFSNEEDAREYLQRFKRCFINNHANPYIEVQRIDAFKGILNCKDYRIITDINGVVKSFEKKFHGYRNEMRFRSICKEIEMVDGERRFQFELFEKNKEDAMNKVRKIYECIKDNDFKSDENNWMFEEYLTMADSIPVDRSRLFESRNDYE